MPGLTLLADLPVPTRTWTNGHHMDRAWRWVTNISFPRNNDSLIELFLFVNVPYVPPCPPRCLNILYLRHVEIGDRACLSRTHARDLMGVSTHRTRFVPQSSIRQAQVLQLSHRSMNPLL
jgi:hypothetical protein